MSPSDDATAKGQPKPSRADIREGLIADVRGFLGRVFPAEEAAQEGGDTPGFEQVETFRGGYVTGIRLEEDDPREGQEDLYLLRWRWHGRYNPNASARRDASNTGVGPVGNEVVVEGLTMVDWDAEGPKIRRFVDWLSVYAQLGLVFEGRPIGLANTTVHQWDPGGTTAGAEEPPS